MLVVITVLLWTAVALAAGGYIRGAYSDMFDRAQMPMLLLCFIAGVGFLGVILK